MVINTESRFTFILINVNKNKKYEKLCTEPMKVSPHFIALISTFCQRLIFHIREITCQPQQILKPNSDLQSKHKHTINK